ncbi:MAG: hypothetical protein ACYC6W_09650 [Nitrosotalea sp.]
MGFKANITNVIHQIVIGSLFILSHVGVVTFNHPVSIGIDVWVATNLIAMSFMILRKSFKTPEVINVKCPKCDFSMETSTLICKNCGSGFTFKDKIK